MKIQEGKMQTSFLINRYMITLFGINFYNHDNEKKNCSHPFRLRGLRWS
jgi:hypothetical protein